MAAKVPFIQTQDRILNQIQNNISNPVNQLTSNPLTNGSILSSVTLTAGPNSINHLLGRTLIGWTIVRLRAASSIYDTQDTNPTPTLTLNLVASATVVCDIYVF